MKVPQRRHHPDGVLVGVSQHFGGSHQQGTDFPRGLAKLDVSLTGKLVPAILDRAGGQVRSVDRGSGGLRV